MSCNIYKILSNNSFIFYCKLVLICFYKIGVNHILVLSMVSLRKFFNVKIQTKFLASFLIFSIIPLVILGIYASNDLRNNIYDQKKSH